MTFPGGMDAVMRQSNALPLPLVQTPITATSFKPTPVPPPRAWQRVAVPSAGHARQRKIWKRVGAAPTNSLPSSYIMTMTELESQGDVARKRGRPARYIPVFGDATWDPKLTDPRDGKWDLIEARASVSAAMEAAATSASSATFNNDSTTCIPRKRHNSRWPIEPTTTTSKRQLADMQPLIEFEVPSVAAPVEPSQQVDEKQMRRRSTRRLSRRISLAPGEESARKLGTVSLSPMKASAPMLSPTKRAPVTSSPTRVAESPRRLFKVDIPSKNLVLESPKTSLPAMSPCKLSPASPMPEPSSIDARLVEANQSAQLDPSPLLFDQPLPVVQHEPYHETRRRISLLSARRSDRRSSSALRLADFETVREAPSRRHSFALEQSAPVDVKSRRNTLDMFSGKPDEARISFGQDDGHDSSHPTNSTEQSTQAILPAYEVDVGTNLDIFGQARQPKAASAVRRKSMGADASTSDLPPVTIDEPAEMETLQSSPAQEKQAPIDTSLSVPSNNLDVAGVTDVEGMGVDQAATSHSPDAHDVNDADCLNLSLDPPSSPTEVGDSTTMESEMEMSQPDMYFGPYDTEGLSTIYEEESSVVVPSPLLTTSFTGLEAMADLGLSPCMGDAVDNKNDTAKTDASEPVGMAQLADEESPSASSERGLDGDEEPPTNEASCRDVVELPVNHVDPAGDVLSTSDSLLERLDAPAVESKAQDISSPSNSDRSIVPQVNHFCGTLSLLVPTKDQNNPTSSNHHSNEMDIDDANAEPQTTSIPVSPPTSHALGISTPDRPVTPAQESSKDLMVPEEGVDAVESSPHSESSGFTPINGRQISPTSPPLTAAVAEAEDVEAESDEVELDELDQEEKDEFMEVEDELTTTGDDEFTLNAVGASKPENDTLTLHDDAEFVRDFVSRVTAVKNAKAAAAAVAVGPPRKVGRPKRRSGSTGSTTTSTGSPVPKTDTPNRKPLGEKSLNTPSPLKLKKRKAQDAGDNTSEDKEEKKNTPEDASEGPKLKRRRIKRAEPVVEAGGAAESPSEPDADASTEGPRRSTRARSTRITLKSAPSANSIAMSMSVRLPGGVAGMMDESIMDSHLTVSKYRNETKELEAVTRGNTRANKAGAVHPNVVLARLAQDPAAWRMKELKGVFDAKESRAASNEAAEDGKGTKSKGVRWAEELVKYQTDGTTNRVFKTMARSLLADIISGDGEDDEDELSLPLLSPEVSTEATPMPAPTPIKKPAAPPRRTRSSKLQAPTPVKKLASGEKKSSISPPVVTAPPARAASSTAKATTTKKTLPTPMATKVAKVAKSTSTARSGMSTRRTKIASLGMGVNGTPAPKRRGRPPAASVST